MDARQQALSNWCAQIRDDFIPPLTMVSGDASFRRYFRVQVGDKALIAMDAPPEKEDSHSFVQIAEAWRRQGIHVPELIEVDLENGFLLIEDFGDQVLLSSLHPEAPDIQQGNDYYPTAIEALLDIQSTDIESLHLPDYDAQLLDREMALFRDWLVDQKLGLTLSESESQMVTKVFDRLRASALAQTQVVVHRDYHARNLMCLTTNQLGILDFQDAVIGPITYDLVSLLRDCYIVWPDEAVASWSKLYFDAACERKLLNTSYQSFLVDFDLMGMQRHLKASGIFARLSMRDGKHSYLNDIPRTLHYLLRIGHRYEEFHEFCAWLETTVIPAALEMDIPTS